MSVDVQALSGISGRVLTPGDDAYDEARKIHNALIDRQPAVIVRCRNAADVAAAIRFARDSGLDVTVRGGGHNVAGRCIADGAVMIDLAEMKNAVVDPEAMTVRAEGGLTWAELNAANAEHGLAVTGGAVSTTGIAGLTLGGGLGWLMSKYGLAADNVLAVELVTADGEILDVTADSHPDLFWALCGGGGNFGVATTFTFRLHPLETVVGGLIAHTIDNAGDMLRFYRDALADCPDDLSVFAGLVYAPDGSGTPLAVMVVCHTGTAEEAERDLAPFKEWGSPAMVEVGTDALPGHEHAARRRPGSGAAQLLAVELHERPLGRIHRYRRRAFFVDAVGAFGDLPRALPRRRDTNWCDRHGGTAPSRGLELPAYLRMVGSSGDRREHRVDEGHVRRSI